jgi:hypothetical protein
MTWAAIAVGGGTAVAGITGSLLSRGGGSTPSTIPLSRSAKLSDQYMQEMLSKSIGLMKGSGTPQELPWFKGMENELNKRANMRTNQVLRDATARGIRGGTLEQVLKVPQEQNMQELLRAILNVYQRNQEQAMPLVNAALGRQAQSEQSMNQQNQLSQQASNDSLQMLMKFLGMGMGGVQGGLSMYQSGEQNKQMMELLKSIYGSGGSSSFTDLSPGRSDW